MLLVFNFSLWAQNLALDFDGVDDFALFNPVIPKSELNPNSFSIELIIEVRSSEDMAIVSQNSQNPFEIGIIDGGFPFVHVNGNTYIFHEYQLEPDYCVQLSFDIEAEDISLFVNGSFTGLRQKYYTGNEVNKYDDWYLGQSLIGLPNYDGIIDQVRGFDGARTLSQINQYLFSQIPFNEKWQNFYFNFNRYTNNNILTDDNNISTHLFLGGLAGTLSHRPTFTEGSCEEEQVITESVSVSCQASIPACAPPTATNELLCNGDFEQYCSDLNNPPSWANTFHAFGSAVSPGSDVVNWTASPGNDLMNSAFFVRNGLGTQNGLQPYAPGSLGFFNIPNSNLFFNPPSNSHNGSGNAYAALVYSCQGGISTTTTGTNYSSMLSTTLNADLKANSTYIFQGQFYKSYWNFFCSFLFGNTTSTDIMITFTDGAGNTFTPANPVITVPHFSLVNGNNGWSALSLTFTTPANLQANTFNQMEISIDNLPLNVNDDEIVYLDDLSLLELSSGRDWPQYVNAGLGINGASGNDIWSNSIKKDSQENLYLMLAVRNDNLDITWGIPSAASLNTGNVKEGSLITKYSPTGTLIWQEFYPHVTFTDIEIDANDNIIASGYTDPCPIFYELAMPYYPNISPQPSTVVTNTPWPNINYTPSAPITVPAQTVTNSLFPGSSKIPVPAVDVYPYNSSQAAVGRINSTTGLANIDAYGDFGNEKFLDVELINNVAYFFFFGEDDPTDFILAPKYSNGLPLITLISGPHSNSILWNNNPFTNEEILFANPTTLINKGNLPYSSPSPKAPAAGVHFSNDFDFRMLGHSTSDVNNIYVLTKGSLSKVSITSSQVINHAYLRGNLNDAPADLASYFQLNDYGEIFISYNQGDYAQEVRKQSDLTLTDTKLNDANNVPTFISCNNQNVYFSYASYTSSSNCYDLKVEKRTRNNSTSIWNGNNLIWTKATSNLDASVKPKSSNTYANLYMSSVYLANRNELAYSSFFRSKAANWTLGTSPHNLIATNMLVGTQNAFTGTILDFGGVPSFKNNLKDSSFSSLNDSFNLYPNPVNNYLNIQCEKKIRTINISHSNGSGVISMSSDKRENLPIDVRLLPKGIYFIRITFSDNTNYESKFIKD